MLNSKLIISSSLLFFIPALALLTYDGRASAVFTGGAWVKSGVHSNPEYVSSDLTSTSSPDSNLGAKFEAELIDKDLWKLSFITVGEYQRFIQSGSSENFTFSLRPILRARSQDGENFTSLSYRLTRSLSTPGIGSNTDYTGNQIQFSFTDFSSPSTHITFNLKYKSNTYSFSSRTDGNIGLGIELRHPLGSNWSVGYEPSFENNSSEIDDFTYVSGALNANVMWIPNDKFFMLLLFSGSARFYAAYPATDTVYFALLTAEYSILKWLSITAEFSVTQSLSSVPSRENIFYNPLIGLEASF